MKYFLMPLLAVVTLFSAGWTSFHQANRMHLYVTSFTDTHYPAPVDFTALLTQKFPYGDGQGCVTPTMANSYDKLWGVDDPDSGDPYSKEPSPAFAQWYVQCIQRLVQTDYQTSMDSGGSQSRYLDQKGHDILIWEWHRRFPNPVDTQGLPSSLDGLAQTVGWTWMTDDHKQYFVTHLIDTFIGPGVLSATDSATLITQVEKSLTPPNGNSAGLSVYDALQSATLAIGMSDAFLQSP